MILHVNGKALEAENHTTASALIAHLGYQNQRIALEVNEAIVPKSQQSILHLNAGDKIEIIKAVGGG